MSRRNNTPKLVLSKHTPPYQRQEARWGWLLVLPCLAGLMLFTYIPTLMSFGLSFSYWNLLGSPHWVGVANYERLLRDPNFWAVLKTTAVFVLSVTGLEIVLGLLLAALLNRIRYGKLGLRAVYFLPFVTPMISVALVWGWLYDPQAGLLNVLLKTLGVLHQPVAWLYDTKTALASVVALEVWKTIGYNMVLFLAGMQAIPPQLYEAAELDGSSAWQTFWRVTLPLLTPTLFFVLMITLIHAIQSFDAVYLLTQGGPEQSTAVLVYWLYKNAFQFYRVGEASALAYLLFVMVLLLTLLQWRLRKRWVLYESDAPG
ncbi:MAG: sugar ABC transporter permease [Candidatus Melainabacteria bacterium]|nr:sugar ABC transporter permease [Candidatus Melainabacteria bacterium]